MLVPATRLLTFATSLETELGVNTSMSPIQFELAEVTLCVATNVAPSVHLKVMLLLVVVLVNRAKHLKPVPTATVPAGIVALKTF